MRGTPDVAGLIPVGTRVEFAKTVSESDIYLFAGITGDFSPNHVNAEYMKSTPYGGIIAHGVLIVGFMSTCSTRVLEHATSSRPAVSYGYDRIRFVKPVQVGDTITVAYEIVAEDVAEAKTTATVTASNQRGELVAVATHILKFL
ncbi:MAG: MaoC family dehydratase N-terminal domain-containing protein [Chloroflexota bacterium]|nr:MaoC family dehydratase N-terminal domain-containing protein [Chloroflexota bacterium]